RNQSLGGGTDIRVGKWFDRQNDRLPPELRQVLGEPQGALDPAALGERREVVGDEQGLAHGGNRTGNKIEGGRTYSAVRPAVVRYSPADCTSRYLVLPMTELLGALPLAAAERSPDAQALKAGRRSCSYAELAGAVRDFAGGLLALGIGRQDRVAVYADKSIEAVTALFGTALAGCVMVPVNPLLKPEQLAYILRDCGVVALVTTGTRLAGLKPELPSCPELRHVVLLDDSESPAEEDGRPGPLVHRFADLLRAGAGRPGAQHRVIDQDMAAILYTSGS